jgi:hypothetical protein
MLVAPGLFAREQTGSAGGSSSIPPALKTAENISALLDLVVLENGKVLGPDASHTIDGLRAHKAAIDGVVAAVKAADQNGQDGVAALRQLADARPTGPRDLFDMQQGRIARMLMMSRRWREQLQQLGALQLPDFHR